MNCVLIDIFAFDLYDDDGSGELSPSEVLKLIQDIFGKSEMKSNVHAKRSVKVSPLRIFFSHQ